MVASMFTSLVRNLQFFFENYMAPVVIWNDVGVVTPRGTDGINVVEGHFQIFGIRHIVRMESPDYDPAHPLGRVLLDARDYGAIDQTTWQAVATHLKTYRAIPGRITEDAQAQTGSQADGSAAGSGSPGPVEGSSG